MQGTRKLETEATRVADALYKQAVSLHDFQSLPVLHARINDSVVALQSLAQAAGAPSEESTTTSATTTTTDTIDISNITAQEPLMVPGALIECIARGESPEAYNRQMAQTLVDSNQKTAGRIQVLEVFFICFNITRCFTRISRRRLG